MSEILALSIYVASFPLEIRARNNDAVLAMAHHPFGGDTTKLSVDIDRWRRRVGSHGIFFSAEISRKTVEISAMIRRTSTGTLTNRRWRP